MIGDAPDEYDLVDPDEPEAGPTPPPRRPTPPGAPGRPLPRMWKSGEAPEPPRAVPEPPRTPTPARSSKPEPPPPPRRRSADDSGSVRKSGLKPKPQPADDGEKKVLVEETPVLDTIETRQRVRLATGALFAFVTGLGVYIFYTAFLYDPFPMDDLPPDDAYLVEPSLPAPKVDMEGEARAMLARAREAAGAGRADQAVALLEQLVGAYGKTRAAAEAKEALTRPSQNLPLFLDGPTVAAAPPAPEPPRQPEPPPAVIDARPATPPDATANATLVPPEPNSPPASPGTPADRRLPAGFAAASDARFDPSGWPTAIVGDRDGARMVLVPGGVFPMGDDRDPAASPSHRVRLSTFYIDEHEVTVGQFRRFLDQSRYRGRSTSTWPNLDEKAATPDDRPMVMVTLADARAFAEWAGKALPSEAQWEAAARTTDGRAHPWGDDPPKYAAGDRPLRQIDAVMAFPEDRSPYGAFDLAGNALEWTADAWDRNYYRALAQRVHDDPTGPEARGRADVVVKGGKGTGASREPIGPEKRMNYVGFRCALQVERPAVSATPTAPEAPFAPAARPSQPARPSTPAAPAQPVVPF
ncbi:SUMF1/EgtB/PvdO family nonheme iron enzyme [Paludisphaera sp.]|uniref:formylglycine-generating enzyme family protein n=1 Tax=Paludisphaera sp. TaxID=2017432 RepID=UPI00301B8C60